MTWLLLAVLAVAVAGITHIVTLLALPWRSADDAYARVAAITLTQPRAVLPAPDASGDRLPLRDPAMLTAVCRFDLDKKPFRLVTSPFAESFVTVGFHSRHGLAFFGLTFQASDASSLELALDHPQTSQDTGGQPPDSRQVAVNAPESQGFVTLSTPLGDGSERTEAEKRLEHIQCVSQPADS